MKRFVSDNKRLSVAVVTAFLAGVIFAFMAPRDLPVAEKTARDLSGIVTFCRQTAENRKYENCFYEKSVPILKKYKLADSVAAMEMLVNDSRYRVFESDRACHEEAHIVGEVSGELSKSPAEAFAACTRVCGFGCFHGVALGVMRKNPETIKNPDKLCESFADSSFPGQDLTACRHGLGHGFSDVASRDVRKALALCKNFSDEGGEMECASGVFMELLEEPSFGREKVTIPPDFAGFCASLEEPFKRMCRHKTGVYKFRETNDIAKAFEACRLLPERDADDCSFNIGADFYFMTREDDKKIWPACAEGSGGESERCLMGAVQSTFANDPTGEIGMVVCETVTDGLLRQRCEARVGEIAGQVSK